MKHNTLKKILSLLLVICMMASFAGCIPGEEDPTEPSTIETTGSTENTTVPTNGTTAPTDSTDTTSRAQRTFIGTNGNPGDIWIVVSEGRNADGESAGLTYSQCARLLGEKGCIFGVPLDGGGSSTMVFQGKVLNSAKAGQRSVVDFVYFK